jgi:predicted nucleic acid-binding protein
MSGDRFLLDSVVLIDHLNGIGAATEFLRQTLHVSQITAITRAEVLTGLAPGDLSLGMALLDRFPLIAIDARLADLAARLRRTHRWRLPDAFQAAAAQHHGLVLVTRNVKDFSPKRHRFVRVPYSV